MDEFGKLYVVGTPIGNLADFSPRAVETLKCVDFIAAEDTRVTMKLLTHFSIQKPLISYFEHNKAKRGDEIITRLMNGESCAIVTDAGMPCISDPGEDLVRLCASHGIDTVVIPGPSAVISALAVSGLITSRFSFEGFLSVTKKQRKKHLDDIKDCTNTLIFYEAPHKLTSTLDDLYKTFGDRKCALCRELTKIHEEVLRGKLSDFIALYEAQPPRGEYVIVIEGAEEKEENAELTLEDAADMARALIEDGEKPSEACKAVAAQTKFSKSVIYKELTN